MKEKVKIGLIAYWFPPENGVAVLRMNAFAKYLDKNKYDLTVFTINNGKEKLEETIDNVKVIRISNPKNKFIINEKLNDYRFIHIFKVIWNVFLAYKLENVDTLWIADMRDEMSKNLHLKLKVRKELSKLEYEINKYANAITSVSKPILDDFRKIMPSVKHFAEIRNGFDHELIPTENYNEIFTINYAGIFYGSIKPDTFFNGLLIFLEKNKINIKLQFIGSNKNFNIPNQLKSKIVFLPKLENKEAVKYIINADCNLLILPKIQRKGVYSGKVFDYLSARKPIIAVVDEEDVAAELILLLNAGFVADFNDIYKIADAIEKAYFWWKDKKGLCRNALEVEQLHRKYQVEKLNTLIDNLLHENN